MLLHHTSGGYGNSLNDPMFTNYGLSNDEFMRNTLLNWPIEYQPGTNYSYSNFGYFVLARVLEKIDP
jgi:CubicO group peptidase (beta-lactamase class C family)